MTVATAIAENASRLCTSTDPAQLGQYTYPAFRRADFKLKWMATRVHTFVFVLDLPMEAGYDVPNLAEAARQWAKEHKGGLPSGMQTGAAAMPVFVLPDISALRSWAESPQPLAWACPLFPIVVNADGSEIAYRRTSQKVGVIYESFFRGLAEQLTAGL